MKTYLHRASFMSQKGTFSKHDIEVQDKLTQTTGMKRNTPVY